MNAPDQQAIDTVARQIMSYRYKLWGYGEGIALEALLQAADRLQEPAYIAFVSQLMDAWLADRSSLPYSDHVAPGRALLMLYQRRPAPALLARARLLADLLADFPRLAEGARLHRPDHPQFHSYVYVDCMDFDAPFLSLLGALTGERDYYDLAVECLLGHARLLWNPDRRLFYHLYDASRKQVNGAFWGRGNGWAALGMVATLESLPPGHASYDPIAELFQQLMGALVRLQAPSGDWHTVLDRPDTYLEGSLAPFFYCALVRGMRLGLLPAVYATSARLAWHALLRRLTPAGLLLGVSEASPPGSAEHYAAIATGGSFPWGQGPALEALLLEADGLPTQDGSIR